MKRLYLFAGGFFFAALQFSYYLSLEWRLSSAWPTYALLTLGWLAGILAGLRLVVRDVPNIRTALVWDVPKLRRLVVRDEALLAINLAGYGLLWLASGRFPFDDRLLPLYALCVLSSGAYAGLFFRSNFERLKDARALLLHENNGFVLGLLAGSFGFYLFGWRFSLWLPFALALALLVFKRMAF